MFLDNNTYMDKSNVYNSIDLNTINLNVSKLSSITYVRVGNLGIFIEAITSDCTFSSEKYRQHEP